MSIYVSYLYMHIATSFNCAVFNKTGHIYCFIISSCNTYLFPISMCFFFFPLFPKCRNMIKTTSWNNAFNPIFLKFSRNDNGKYLGWSFFYTLQTLLQRPVFDHSPILLEGGEIRRVKYLSDLRTCGWRWMGSKIW